MIRPGLLPWTIDYFFFSAEAFENIPEDTSFDLARLYQTLLAGNQLAAHEVHERFYEVGSFAGIEELGYYLQHANRVETQENA